MSEREERMERETSSFCYNRLQIELNLRTDTYFSIAMSKRGRSKLEAMRMRVSAHSTRMNGSSARGCCREIVIVWK